MSFNIFLPFLILCFCVSCGSKNAPLLPESGRLPTWEDTFMKPAPPSKVTKKTPKTNPIL